MIEVCRKKNIALSMIALVLVFAIAIAVAANVGKTRQLAYSVDRMGVHTVQQLYHVCWKIKNALEIGPGEYHSLADAVTAASRSLHALSGPLEYGAELGLDARLSFRGILEEITAPWIVQTEDGTVAFDQQPYSADTLNTIRKDLQEKCASLIGQPVS